MLRSSLSYKVVIFALALFCGSAHAADRYVRAGATGANNGTDWANAWTSLSSINWTTIGSGGTLWIAAGSYSGGLGNPNSTNQALKRATIATHGTSTGWSDAYDGQVTITPSSGTRFLSIGTGADNFVIDGQAWDPWKLKGVGVRGYDGMLQQAGADNVTIRGIELDGQQEVTASGAPEDGIRWMGGQGGLIEHSFIHDYGQTGGAHNDAIQGPTCNNIEIRFSRFANSGMHVFLGDYEWSNQYCDGINIHHNVFYNDANGNSYNCIVFKGTHQGAIIDNNTFDIKSQGSVLYLANDPSPGCCNTTTGGQFRNNIVYQSDLNDVSFYGHSYNTYYGGASLSETGGSTSNPLLVNPTTHDYHLQSGSPAIGSGTNLGYTTDYEGKAVGNPPDRGAIQYQAAAPDTQAPTTPGTPTANPTGSTTMNLSWTASTDNVAVTGYNVRRCTGAACTPSTIVGTPSTNSYSDTGLTASTLYRYTVQAYDAASNTSSQSPVGQGTTLAPSQYTVTPSIVLGAAHGTISPETPQTVTEGTTTQFTVTPASGYKAVMGGTCGGNLVGATYTTNTITGACTVQASFMPTSCALDPSNGTATNVAMTSQAGTFTYLFSVIPAASNHDLTLGHTNGNWTAYTSYSTTVRFSDTGVVDVRNGAVGYAADVVYPYSAGVQYNVRIVANVATDTYNAYIAADGQAETQIANNYAFRTLATSLNNFAYVGLAGAATGAYACPLGLSGGDTTAPTVQARRILASGNSFELDLDEPAGSVSGSAGLTLSASGGAVTLAGCSAASDIITCSTSRQILGAETVTASYSGSGGIADTSGNPLASFSTQSVTNNSTQSLVALSLLTPPDGTRYRREVTSTTIGLTTSKAASCRRASTTGVAWASMTTYTTTGSTSHSSSYPLRAGGVYQVCSRCLDTAAQQYSTDSCTRFSVRSDRKR